MAARPPLDAAAPTPAWGTPAANQPPVPVFKTTPEVDAQGVIRAAASPDGVLEVQFNLCPSSDPESDRLLFSHDFDGDGRDEKTGLTGASCRHPHAYRAAVFAVERYRARDCVVDVDEKGAPRRDPVCVTYTIEVLGPALPQGESQVTPTPTPTPTSTPTATPAVPTPTATPALPTPTATPALPTATPTATPTVMPTSTPTATPTVTPTNTPAPPAMR